MFLTDADIVIRVRNGNSEAYGELVARSQDAVYAQAFHYLQNFEDVWHKKLLCKRILE